MGTEADEPEMTFTEAVLFIVGTVVIVAVVAWCIFHG